MKNPLVIFHINSIFSSISYRINDIIIDVGDDWKGFFNVSTVLLTHAHFDHIYGLNKIIGLNPNIRIYTNSSGREMLLNSRKNLSFYHGNPFILECPDRIVVVKDSEEMMLEDDIRAKAVFTPGHNPSCITWVIKDAVFSGDSYIPGIKPVTNLPHGDRIEAAQSVERIKKLSVGRRIFPGHRVSYE